jgi:iron-regulated transporter 1
LASAGIIITHLQSLLTPSSPTSLANSPPLNRPSNLQVSLSLFRGAGAVSGLLATVIFPRVHRSVGLVTAGFVGVAWINACLLTGTLPTVVAAAVGAPPTVGGPGGGVGGGLINNNRSSSSGFINSTGAAGGVAGDAVGRGSPLLILLLCGLVASRLGIWLFDLAVSQLQQELVAHDELGEWVGRLAVGPNAVSDPGV